MKDSNNVTPGRSVEHDSKSISTSLLQRVRAHDPEGWNRLAELYGPLVYRWCLRARLQPADAEDVVQEVFRTVAAKVAQFQRERAIDTFRGWIWTITRNKLGDHIRRMKGGPVAEGGTDARVKLSELPDQELDETTGSTGSDDVGGLYQRALRLIRTEFEDLSWQAFWCVAVEGQRAADVAADLGISANAVYIAKSRILQRLRAELGDE